MATVLITGTTGTIGSEVVRELADKGGVTVRAGVRRASKAENLGGAGVQLTQVVKDATGRPALSFRRFAEEHAGSWRVGA